MSTGQHKVPQSVSSSKGSSGPWQPGQEGWLPPPSAAVRTVHLKGFGLISVRWLAWCPSY